MILYITSHHLFGILIAMDTIGKDTYPKAVRHLQAHIQLVTGFLLSISASVGSISLPPDINKPEVDLVKRQNEVLENRDETQRNAESPEDIYTSAEMGNAKFKRNEDKGKDRTILWENRDIDSFVNNQTSLTRKPVDRDVRPKPQVTRRGAKNEVKYENEANLSWPLTDVSPSFISANNIDTEYKRYQRQIKSESEQSFINKARRYWSDNHLERTSQLQLQSLPPLIELNSNIRLEDGNIQKYILKKPSETRSNQSETDNERFEFKNPLTPSTSHIDRSGYHSLLSFDFSVNKETEIQQHDKKYQENKTLEESLFTNQNEKTETVSSLAAKIRKSLQKERQIELNQDLSNIHTQDVGSSYATANPTLSVDSSSSQREFRTALEDPYSPNNSSLLPTSVLCHEMNTLSKSELEEEEKRCKEMLQKQAKEAELSWLPAENEDSTSQKELNCDPAQTENSASEKELSCGNESSTSEKERLNKPRDTEAEHKDDGEGEESCHSSEDEEDDISEAGAAGKEAARGATVKSTESERKAKARELLAKFNVEFDDGRGNIEELRQVNKALKESKLCRVCRDKDANRLFLPCAHLACCSLCSPAVVKCPQCKSNVRGIVSVYFP